jgi:Kef-type K+ transport system membrane component KefB
VRLEVYGTCPNFAFVNPPLLPLVCRAADRWHVSLIGELLAGALLGPGLANVVPFVDAWKLAGELALCFLVFDGALSLDLYKLRRVGVRAVVIAATGVVLPVLLAWGIMRAFAYSLFASLAAGVALASTAIGSAAVLLKTHSLHETEMGWMIASAAILDDVFSLVLLATVSRLGVVSDPSTVAPPTLFFPGTTDAALLGITPLLASIIVALAALVLTATVFPWFFRVVPDVDRLWGVMTLWCQPPPEAVVVAEELAAMPSRPVRPAPPPVAAAGPAAHHVRRHWILYTFALTISTGLAVTADVLGTSLLFGVFVSGSCLSSGLRATESPVAQAEEANPMPRAEAAHDAASVPTSVLQAHGFFSDGLSSLCARLFFSSMGLSIPTTVLFRPPALLLGLCLTLVPGVLGKWLTGALFERDSTRLHVVGFSMVSRGDLGFLLARTAQANGLLDPVAYAAVVWALLLCTALGPLVVSRILHRQEKPQVPRQPEDRTSGLISVDSGADVDRVT